MSYILFCYIDPPNKVLYCVIYLFPIRSICHTSIVIRVLDITLIPFVASDDEK